MEFNVPTLFKIESLVWDYHELRKPILFREKIKMRVYGMGKLNNLTYFDKLCLP